ncbi:MAG: type III pantothenate kinase [Planctomycetes bacterium]|nr:type III pantothenate kinase [Planctomycetota bacterium]
MWLAIDIGNTNIHIGIFENDVLHSSCSVKSEFPRLLPENLEKILNPATLSKLQAVVLSSVNPKTEVFVIDYIQKHLLVNPQFIGKDIPVPMPVLTDQPERVGVDRLLNALAAFERTKTWTIVVDAGTAITVDVVNDNGAFMGGIIAPGMGISSKALHHYTALLPEIFINRPKKILGKNTEDAISSGIYWGTVGMVSRVISMLCDELGCQPAIIATGGDAQLLAPEIPIITAVLPDLTLEGIGIAYKKNLTSNIRN